MNSALRKLIYPFLLPNGVLCCLLLFGLSRSDLPLELQPFINAFPYVVVVLGPLLAWRFNRTRVIYSIGLLLLVEVICIFFAAGALAQGVFELIALLLPLHLFLVSCFKERGLVHQRNILWLIFLAMELLGLAWLLDRSAASVHLWLNYPLVVLPSWGLLPLPQPILLTHLLVLLLFLWRASRQAIVFEFSFFWAQLVLTIGFTGLGAQPLRLYLAGAGLLLIVGIMENSHSLAYRDELTGLPGRRALNEALAKLGNRYSLAMLDIDHFKKFNDTHGHDVGDQVLKMVAGKLATVGGGGNVFRFGGEEFLVVFARKKAKEVQPFLEALRRVVEDARFIPRGKDRPPKKPKKKLANRNRAAALKVTISIGVAERGSKAETTDAVLKAADQALYRAKKKGRNRVCS